MQEQHPPADAQHVMHCCSCSYTLLRAFSHSDAKIASVTFVPSSAGYNSARPLQQARALGAHKACRTTVQRAAAASWPC